MIKNAVYDIWTDGSYREAHNIAGAGWLIRHNGLESEGQDRIFKLHGEERKHGSDIAEVFAVVCALRKVPRGSQVFIRLDCQNVCDWLTRGEITTPSKMKIPALIEMFDKAMRFSEELDSFSVNKISGRMNDCLNRVHRLSQTASSPGR